MLVVIDMQDFYIDKLRESGIITNVLREIDYSKSVGEPIFLLETKGVPTTIHEIPKTLLGYEYYGGEKKLSNGADTIKAVLDTKDITVDQFNLVGLYGCACVAKTARGLTTLFPHAEINVITDSIGCPTERKVGLCQTAMRTYQETPINLIRARGLPSPSLSSG